MNILFLTPQLPFPPRQGTAIRNWGLIRHLSQRHAITLLSFAAADASVPPELKAACRQVIALPAPRRTPGDRLRTLFSTEPDLARRLWSPEFAGALAALLRAQAFDVVQIEGLEMVPYLTSRGGRPPAPRLIYDAHNAEYVIQRRALATDWRQPRRWPAALYSAIQWTRLRRFEAETCRAMDAVTCVSPEDAAALRALGAEAVVVPNGIDLRDYRSSAPQSLLEQTPTLVFTGKMDYRPNIDAALWFAAEILPRIRTRQPQAQFVVVGQKPPEALRRLNGQEGIVVTGAVDDARPFIAGCAVYVAPLRMGGGTRFKLLEAMALARPIVSTTIGAEGFPVQAGRELLLADSPGDFAQSVVSVLENTALAAALGLAGRRLAQDYDWSVILPRLEAVYERLSAARPA